MLKRGNFVTTCFQPHLRVFESELQNFIDDIRYVGEGFKLK